jgi:hypothetical protein
MMEKEEEEKRVAHHQTIPSIIGSIFCIVSTFVSRTQQVMNSGGQKQ